jgi:ferritin-like metal-binding protein YciE
LAPASKVHRHALLTLHHRHLMKTQAQLIVWLRDAYAMEKAMEQALTGQMNNADSPGCLREQATAHCLETQRHADAMVACIKTLGADERALKAGPEDGIELFQAAGISFAHPDRIKALLSLYAAGHFEIAHYTALRTGAMRLGLNGIVLTCDQIILEETRMALWLDLHLPKIVKAWLEKP